MGRSPKRPSATTTTTRVEGPDSAEVDSGAPSRPPRKRRPTADALPLFAQAMRREDAQRAAAEGATTATPREATALPLEDAITPMPHVAEPTPPHRPARLSASAALYASASVTHVSTGLVGLDRALRGGFSTPGAHLVAARPHVGTTALLVGAALAAVKRGQRVAVLTERLRPEQVRGRLVVLEARINAFRFRAGIISEEDRRALAEARAIIPWTQLSIVAERRISPRLLEEHVFSYRPSLVLVDSLGHVGAAELAAAAGHRNVALVERITLPRADYAPTRLDLPRVGELARVFDSVILLHRDDVETPLEGDAHVGAASASVIRVAGHDVEPRHVSLRFDQRFAGLFDP